MPSKPIATLPDDLNYATFSGRMLAAIVDIILISIVLIPIIGLIEGWTGLDQGFTKSRQMIEAGISTYNDIIQVILLRLPSLCFELFFITFAVCMCWVIWDATPGKLFFRMRIVDGRSFSRPSVKQYLLRLFGYALVILPFGLGFLSIYFNKKTHQGWHDKLAHTLVVKKTVSF